MATPRTYLGRDQNMGGMVRVYLLPDALEVDETSFVEIERTRVYFDDVLAITYHRAVNKLLVTMMGIVGGIFLLIGALGRSEQGLLLAMLFMSTPFLLTVLIHLILRTDVITVFGRRTMARIKFPFRKGRAREIYRDLTVKIRAHQAALAAAQPKPPPPPGPELPPGPPPPLAEPPPPAPAAPPSL